MQINSKMHKKIFNIVRASKRFYNVKKRVAVIGGGNWGTVVSKMVAENLLKGVNGFHEEMLMYVKHEMVQERSLYDIINETRVNQKYMRLCAIPQNVTASSNLAEVTSSSDLLILVFPHQFVNSVCEEMRGHIRSGAKAVSLIKGFELSEEGHRLNLVSNIVQKTFGTDCGVIMGANIADEVALEKYSEATIGCRDPEFGSTIHKLFQTPYFKLALVLDAETVELCGALKNIIAVGTGFATGLSCGQNTNSAVIRLGFVEMIAFINQFYGECRMATFFESCGIGDLVTTSVAGRNHLVAKEFARISIQSTETKSIWELEEVMLRGQKLQGPDTAADVALFLHNKNMQHCYPLFTTIHKICKGELPIHHFINALRDHPHHTFPASLPVR